VPRDTLRRVNAALKTGGQWLSFGSLAFGNVERDPANSLTMTELTELATGEGFAPANVVQQKGPYLCSPHSRFGRTELLHALATTKLTHSPAAVAAAGEPAWLTACDKAIPCIEHFRQQAVSTQIHAYLMSLIDSKRSIKEIAAVFDEQRLMNTAEAVPVIQNFLRRMYRDS
jgi:hypothetical protein